MTWLLRGLALLLAIGAIVAALIGYRLSTQPPPAQPVPPTESVLKALKPLRAGEPIRAEDVALQPVSARPAGSFAAPAQVVGQSPIAAIPAGEVLTRAHFPAAEAQLLRSLHAGERAVAIKVDEVVGLGGFAQPGDRVDVLLYLRGSPETANASSAQVVLGSVRLLAYGESLQQPPPEGESVAARASDKVSARPRATTSAVLAVPEAAASRLMLAANSGALRLSLRPPEPAVPGAVADPHLIRLAEIAQAARPAPEKRLARGVGGNAVIIHEGDAVRAAAVPSR